MKAFLTGADGFIGGHLTDYLQAQGWRITGCTRRVANDRVSIDLATAPITEQAAAIGDAEIVFHLAGRAHRQTTEQAAYVRDNVEATQRVFEAALAAGVRHFVFVSTIRVLGEASDSPFTKAHPRRPVDAYAESKAQAEVWLMAQRGRIPSISIVRPPLVYGPGVRANFLRLMNAVGRGWPLPVGCAVAPRSQIAVTNLTHFLGTCARHSHTCELLHCRDDEDYSVRDLVLLLAQCMGRKARLLSIEPRVVRACARLVGAGDAAARVFERAQVDDSEARVLLSWQPPVDSRTALAATVRWWCTR